MGKRKSKGRVETDAQLRRKCEKFLNWYLKKVGLLPFVVCTSDKRERRFSSVLLRPSEKPPVREYFKEFDKGTLELLKNEIMEKLAQMGRIPKNL